MEYMDIIKTSMLGFGIVLVLLFVLGYLSYLINKKRNNNNIQYQMADFEQKTAVIVKTPNCKIGGCEKYCDPDHCTNFNCRYNTSLFLENEIQPYNNTFSTEQTFNRTNFIRWR